MRCFIILFVIFYSTMPLCAVLPTVAEIVARHEETLSRIKTVSANYETKSVIGDQVKIKEIGTYKKLNSKVLIKKANSSTLIADGLSKGVGIGTRDNRMYQSAGVKASNKHIDQGDIYYSFLLDKFGGPGETRLTLAELYNISEEDPVVDEVEYCGSTCIRVTIEFKYMSDTKPTVYRVWHDPSKGYLVVKSEYYAKHYPQKVTHWVLSGWGYYNRIMFPTEQTLYSTLDGVRDRYQTVILKNLKINEIISPQEFVLPPIQHGIQCTDSITMTKYPIDANWKQIGPSKPYIIYKVASAAPRSNMHEFNSQPSTSEPPRRTGWYLVILAVCFFITAAGVAFYRRRQNRKAEIA